MPKCSICGKPVNVKKNHVCERLINKDGTRSKKKTYSHVECNNFINETSIIGVPLPKDTFVGDLF